MIRYAKHSTAIILTIAVMTGCGGGGGGSISASSTPAAAAQIDSTNQTVASQDVAAASLSTLNNSQTALAAAATNESALYAAGYAHLDKLGTYVADAHANASATGAVSSQSYSCPLGGSYVVSVNDADNSGTATPGDSVTGTFYGCADSSGTLNGTLGFVINTLTGTYGTLPYSVSVTMTFGNFSLTAPSFTASLNGDITVAGSKSGTNAFTLTVSSTSMSGSATYGSLTRTRTLSNYSATETRVPDATYTYLSTVTIQGTLTSSGFNGTRSVTFSTPTAIVRRGTDTYAYTGVLLIQGAQNSALRLTALSNTQVQEDLDSNGDGVYESTSVVNWNTLY